ncbi:hypothetical protein GVAV_003135 [Gurleya vavrai]
MDNYNDGYIQSSPQQNQSVSKTYRALTIKQIRSIDSKNNIFKKDNAAVNHVTVLGWIRGIRKLQNGVSFQIDDHTAQIECSFFHQSAFDAEMLNLIEENNFVKMAGSLKTFNGNITISCTHILKTHFDNLTFHYISCIYQHMYFTNKLKRDVKEKKEGGFEEIQSEILNIYRDNQGENGLNIEVVLKMLSGKYKENELRDNIEVLLEAGNIYVVDGEDYKTTDF